jgi:hypothetical protein
MMGILWSFQSLNNIILTPINKETEVCELVVAGDAVLESRVGAKWRGGEDLSFVIAADRSLAYDKIQEPPIRGLIEGRIFMHAFLQQLA